MPQDIADVKDRKQLFTSIEEEYEHMNWSSSPASTCFTFLSPLPIDVVSFS